MSKKKVSVMPKVEDYAVINELEVVKVDEVDSIEEVVAVKFLNEAPFKANYSDAGFDIKCSKGIIIGRNNSAVVQTGLKVEIPKGYYGLVLSRSGLNIKQGVQVATGVIDSGYRGEILVRLINTGDSTFECKAGDRIAQLVVMPCLLDAVVVEEFTDSDRGDKGFGSSGR